MKHFIGITIRPFEEKYNVPSKTNNVGIGLLFHFTRDDDAVSAIEKIQSPRTKGIAFLLCFKSTPAAITVTIIMKFSYYAIHLRDTIRSEFVPCAFSPFSLRARMTYNLREAVVYKKRLKTARVRCFVEH